MLLTEEIAKKKICPFAGLVNLISKNLADVRDAYCCVGSDCMMWRVPEGYDVKTGFCGLAGNPISGRKQ